MPTSKARGRRIFDSQRKLPLRPLKSMSVSVNGYLSDREQQPFGSILRAMSQSLQTSPSRGEDIRLGWRIVNCFEHQFDPVPLLEFYVLSLFLGSQIQHCNRYVGEIKIKIFPPRKHSGQVWWGSTARFPAFGCQSRPLRCCQHQSNEPT
jgi:hypothetical protein